MAFLLPHASDVAAPATSPMLSPYFAAGRVFGPGFVSSILCGLVRLPLLPELLEELLLGTAQKGCLLLWDVPPQQRRAEYGALFETLLTRHAAVPVGLLRAGGDTASPLPFVLTNPPAHTRLAPDDRV